MGRLTSPLAGTQLTASWSDGQVSGTAGCNSYSATYTVDKESLSIQPPVATKMACAEPPGIMEQEAGYLAALQLASSFTSTTAQLQVFNSDGNVVLVFVSYAPLPPATEAPAEARNTGPGDETPVALDGAWERIQVAGKIVPAPRPATRPSEYYVGPDLDGFDIALMDEIGQRLGMPSSTRTWMPKASCKAWSTAHRRRHCAHRLDGGGRSTSTFRSTIRTDPRLWR
jgi:hypothetical protein